MTDREGRGRDHQFWDGDKLWKAGNELTAEQRRLPLLRLPTTAAFIRRLGEGWTPERDEELLMETRRRQTESTTSAATVPRGTQHYLYFSFEDAARSAAMRVVALGGAASVRASAHRGKWLVLADAPSEWNRDQADREFQTIAKDLGGDWDGTETSIT